MRTISGMAALFALLALAPTAGADQASDDFAARCAAPGVVKCVGFDDPADIAGTWGDNSGILSGATTAALDATTHASGASSLLFTIPSGSGADTSGSYFTNFSADLSVQMGAGDALYIQWRQRFSVDFLASPYPGGGGWKQAIIGSGDQPGQLYSSCSDLEVVTQNNYHRGFPHLYNSCSGSAVGCCAEESLPVLYGKSHTLPKRWSSAGSPPVRLYGPKSIASSAGAPARATHNFTRLPNTTLAMLDDGEALDLGAFPCTVPAGDGYACEQVTDYSGMVYDCKNHQLLMFGGGHATTFTDTVFAFAFDTLGWSELYAPTPCTSQYMGMANFDSSRAAWVSGPSGPYPRPLSRHTYDLNIYVDTLDEFLLMEGPNGDSSTCPPGSTGYTYAALKAQIAHYGIATGNWSFSGTKTPDGHPDAMGGEYPAAELDPISGLVVVLGAYGLYVYDPVAKTKTVALDNYNQSTFPGDLGYANHLVYFPPTDRFYYFDRGGPVWELVFDRANPASSTVTQLVTSGSAPQHYEPGYAYDPVHKIIGGAVTNDMFYAFNPATGSWSARALVGSPGTAAFHAVSYDPVDNVFLFVTEARHTWAYRYAP